MAKQASLNEHRNSPQFATEDGVQFGERAKAQLELEGIATWRGGARAAYSIVHDDLGRPKADGILRNAAPQAHARGLAIAVAAVAKDCEERRLWDQLRALQQDGHEILNHSYSHQNLVEHPDHPGEIDRARQVLEAGLGRPVTFFVFPYDEWDEAGISHLRGNGYLGARCGERGVNAPDFADDLRIGFDVYGPSYSAYSGDVLSAQLDAAIATSGWAMRELHGVADDSWEAISLADYSRHLDDVCERVQAGLLWVATPSEVIRYRRARELFGNPSLLDGKLRFPEPPAEALGFCTKLSVLLKTTEQEAAALRAEQAGQSLDVRRISKGLFTLDVDPMGGSTDIFLS